MRPATLALLLSLVGCASADRTVSLPAVLASDDRIAVMGRHHVEADGAVAFAASGVTFVVRFRGTGLSARLDDAFRDGNYNWFTVVVDGGEPSRFRTRPGRETYVLAEGLSEGEHTLTLSKATEGQNGRNRLVALWGAEILSAPPLPDRRIEFIGDSITAGFGADTDPVACGEGSWFDPTHAWIAYGPRLARRLGAQWMLSAVSGIGMHRNWSTPGPTMPSVYDDLYLEHDADNPPWDPSRYPPDLVVVALGTNDVSAGDGETPRAPLDGDAFVEDYVRFLADLRVRYPAPPFLLINSPGFEGEKRVTLAGYLDRVAARRAAAGDAATSVFTFDGTYLEGCTGHPSGEDHAAIADELEPAVRRITGW